MTVQPQGRSPRKEERLQIREDAKEMSCSQIDTLRKSGSQAQPECDG